MEEGISQRWVYQDFRYSDWQTCSVGQACTTQIRLYITVMNLYFWICLPAASSTQNAFPIHSNGVLVWLCPLCFLQVALTGAPPSSEIFLFTDAPAKDLNLMGTVIALIERTKSVVSSWALLYFMSQATLTGNIYIFLSFPLPLDLLTFTIVERSSNSFTFHYISSLSSPAPPPRCPSS